MSPGTLRSPLGWLLALSLAAVPAHSITLAVTPAHPLEDAPFVLLIGLEGACPFPSAVSTTPTLPIGRVDVTLTDLCPTLPLPQLVEVPIGPLRGGPWMLRVHVGNEVEELSVEVQRLPFAIEIDPPFPQAGVPFTARVAGNGPCIGVAVEKVVRDGRLLTIAVEGECHVPTPSSFEVDLELGPLLAGDYVAQVTQQGLPVASRSFHVFDPFECRPSDTALCLQGGRYRVEATWKTATGEGVAHVRPETADSGSLWFFDEDNLELLVKVLDACHGPQPRVWFFAAGLTNVEVEITVTDVPTGAVRRYKNPRDTPFAPILDTAAFACPAPGNG